MPQKCVCVGCFKLLSKLGATTKYPTGCITSHGHNAFKLSYQVKGMAASYPCTQTMGKYLYTPDHSENSSAFDRRNWLCKQVASIGETNATYPHEFWLNRREGLPQWLRRPDGDIRARGIPDIVSCPSPRNELRFHISIANLEADFAAIHESIGLSDLVRRCCEETGVEMETLHKPDEASRAARARQKADFKSRGAAVEEEEDIEHDTLVVDEQFADAEDPVDLCE